jgi:maleate cis-trans isomerase
MEIEYRRVLPETVNLHVGRLKLREVTVKGLEEMETHVEDEADKLADANVDVIGYGCGSGRAIVRRIEKQTGISAIATAGAVLDALKLLAVDRVAVATPYVNAINRMEKKFLQENGVNVTDIQGLNIADNRKIGMTTEKDVLKLVGSLKQKTATAIFLSCTNLPTIQLIDRLEETYCKPVISSNTATLWAMLKQCCFSVAFQGRGRFLK